MFKKGDLLEKLFGGEDRLKWMVGIIHERSNVLAAMCFTSRQSAHCFGTGGSKVSVWT